MTTRTDQPRTTDRIEKHFEVRASRSRVWRAIASAEEFGTWFGMNLDRPFAPGANVLGRLTIKGYDHVTVEIQVEKIEPESYFSYRWHPYAVDPAIDYRAEQGMAEALRFEAASASPLFTSDDMTKGYAAMAEKRDPGFEGK